MPRCVLLVLAGWVHASKLPFAHTSKPASQFCCTYCTHTYRLLLAKGACCCLQQQQQPGRHCGARLSHGGASLRGHHSRSQMLKEQRQRTDCLPTRCSMPGAASLLSRGISVQYSCFKPHSVNYETGARELAWPRRSCKVGERRRIHTRRRRLLQPLLVWPSNIAREASTRACARARPQARPQQQQRGPTARLAGARCRPVPRRYGTATLQTSRGAREVAGRS